MQMRSLQSAAVSAPTSLRYPLNLSAPANADTRPEPDAPSKARHFPAGAAMADFNSSTSYITREDGLWKFGRLDGWVYDCEVFPNLFLASFTNGVKTVTFDQTQFRELAAFVNDTAKVLIGYNNIKYDDLLLRAIHQNPKEITTAKLYEISGLIIADWKALTDNQRKDRSKLTYARRPWNYSIDLYEVTNCKGSLKELQCRLGLPTVAESPLPFDQPVPQTEIASVVSYNLNDVSATEAVLEDAKELVELRRTLEVRYSLDKSIYSKSDAKIAEHYMLVMNRRQTGTETSTLKNLAKASLNNYAPSFNVAELLPVRTLFTKSQFKIILDNLKASRITRSAKGKLELDTPMPGNQVDVDGLTLTFGCGGLHSEDEPGVFHSDEDTHLWDVDVTSFYPSMMTDYGIKPQHMLSAFTSILKSLLDDRVAAKKAGDKLTANSLKLVINSIFGKLGDIYSPLRDDRACMQVTIGGQILLLMLIEMTQAAGATVLSANTDGLLLRVPKDKATDIESTLKAWEESTSLTLEKTEYRTVARRDVNNYVAIPLNPDKHGDIVIKSKGAYNVNATKLSGRIIPLAVQEHLRTGVSIDAFIMNHVSATDFLFYQRAKSDGHFEQKGQRLPKTIRWFVPASDDTTAIERVSASGKDRTTVPNAHRATLALELPIGFSLTDLPGLDRQYYIKQATKLLNSALASPEVDRGTAQARTLQAMGLTLLPKREGKNPAGIHLDDLEAIQPLADRRCESWGVVTGPYTQTLTLDLDKPEALSPAIKAIIAANPTLTTWHGIGTADEVRAGTKRGAITFHYDGQDARICTRYTKEWVVKHGFEVMYGKKVQTVIGQHLEAGDDYVQDGVVADAPAELIEYLGLRLGQPRKKKAAVQQTDTTDPDLLRQAADAVFGAGWASFFDSRDGWKGVEGATPGEGKRANLRLWVRHGRVCGFTFHANYDTRGSVALVQAEYDRLLPPNDPSGGPGDGTDGGPGNPIGNPDTEIESKTLTTDPGHLDPSDAPPALNEEERREATSCEDAFNQIQGVGVVIGATGTGKSWQAAKRAIERHELSEYTLLVAPDKEGIEQTRKYLIQLWTEAGRNPIDLKFQLLTSSQTKDDEEESDGKDKTESSRNGVKKSTLIVVTHHHFASRKPLTNNLYAIQYWVEENHAEVILDEGDLYVERQNHYLQFDARYTFIGGKNGRWIKGNHCPSEHGAFRCKACAKRSGGCVVNHGTHRSYDLPHKLLQSQFTVFAKEEFTIDPENLPIDDTIDLPGLNIRLSSLSQTPGYLGQRDFDRKPKNINKKEDDAAESNDKPDLLTYLRDVIDCSYRPTLAEPLVVGKDGTFLKEDPYDLANQTGPDGKPLIDGIATVDWHFPYFPCRSRFTLLYDRSAMFFMMRNASRVIIMSATIGDQDLAFLRSCAGGRPLVTITIPAPTRQPLDQVIIIGHQSRIDWKAPLGERAANAMGCDYTNIGLCNRTTVERLGNALAVAGKPPLIFMPTKEYSTAVFHAMRERGWSYFIEGEYHLHVDRAIAETKTTDGSMGLISYSRSSLGTGANLPQYDVVVVDGTVRRPHYLFNPDIKTEDSYLEAQENDRTKIMTQNIGRILRGSGVKCALVVGITPSHLAKLAMEVERQAVTKTATWFTPDDTDTAMAALVASVKAGHLVVPNAPENAPKGRKGMSKKQRAKADATGAPKEPETLSEERLLNAMAKVEAFARSGKTWREASRAVNATRLGKALTSLLQDAFVAAGGRPGRLKAFFQAPPVSAQPRASTD